MRRPPWWTPLSPPAEKARALALDTGDNAAVAAFFAEHVKDTDLHVLVNNAGITRDGLLVRMKDADFETVIRVNLIGAFTCLREAAKLMMKRRAGRIVNISSVVGQSGNAGQANYAAAKAGLVGLTKSAALELASRGITVNAVAPGFVETDMTAVLPDAVKATFSDRIPVKRACAPEEIAAAVGYLVSDEAAYVTAKSSASTAACTCNKTSLRSIPGGTHVCRGKSQKLSWISSAWMPAKLFPKPSSSMTWARIPWISRN
jgi:3-oxoacyl-[acyl-carrier protein] reductase